MSLCCLMYLLINLYVMLKMVLQVVGSGGDLSIFWYAENAIF